MKQALGFCVAAAVAVGLALPAVSQPNGAPDEAQSLAIGRAVVERNCAMCHAVGVSGPSPNPQAPAFRDMSQRLDVEALGEGLARGILTEHPSMPEFRLSTTEVVGVIRYLRSIQRRQRTEAAPRRLAVG